MGIAATNVYNKLGGEGRFLTFESESNPSLTSQTDVICQKVLFLLTISLTVSSLAVPAGSRAGAHGGAGRPAEARGGRGQGPAGARHGRQAQGRLRHTGGGYTMSACQVMSIYSVSMSSNVKMFCMQVK